MTFLDKSNLKGYDAADIGVPIAPRCSVPGGDRGAEHRGAIRTPLSARQEA